MSVGRRLPVVLLVVEGFGFLSRLALFHVSADAVFTLALHQGVEGGVTRLVVAVVVAQDVPGCAGLAAAVGSRPGRLGLLLGLSLDDDGLGLGLLGLGLGLDGGGLLGLGAADDGGLVGAGLGESTTLDLALTAGGVERAALLRSQRDVLRPDGVGVLDRLRLTATGMLLVVVRPVGDTTDGAGSARGGLAALGVLLGEMLAHLGDGREGQTRQSGLGGVVVGVVGVTGRADGVARGTPLALVRTVELSTKFRGGFGRHGSGFPPVG